MNGIQGVNHEQDLQLVASHKKLIQIRNIDDIIAKKKSLFFFVHLVSTHTIFCDQGEDILEQGKAHVALSNKKVLQPFRLLFPSINDKVFFIILFIFDI